MKCPFSGFSQKNNTQSLGEISTTSEEEIKSFFDELKSNPLYQNMHEKDFSTLIPISPILIDLGEQLDIYDNSTDNQDRKDLLKSYIKTHFKELKKMKTQINAFHLKAFFEYFKKELEKIGEHDYFGIENGILVPLSFSKEFNKGDCIENVKKVITTIQDSILYIYNKFLDDNQNDLLLDRYAFIEMNLYPNMKITKFQNHINTLVNLITGVNIYSCRSDSSLKVGITNLQPFSHIYMLDKVQKGNKVIDINSIIQFLENNKRRKYKEAFDKDMIFNSLNNMFQSEYIEIEGEKSINKTKDKAKFLTKIALWKRTSFVGDSIKGNGCPMLNLKSEKDNTYLLELLNFITNYEIKALKYTASIDSDNGKTICIKNII